MKCLAHCLAQGGHFGCVRCRYMLVLVSSLNPQGLAVLLSGTFCLPFS